MTCKQIVGKSTPKLLFSEGIYSKPGRYRTRNEYSGVERDAVGTLKKNNWKTEYKVGGKNNHERVELEREDPAM